MAVIVRKQHVRTPPGQGKPHAILRCTKCRRQKALLEPLTDRDIDRLQKRSVCSSCGSTNITLDVFVHDTGKPAGVRRPADRHCQVCGVRIAEAIIDAVPHTRCCALHLDQNPPARPVVVEPMGSREDFKKDRAANWSQARRPKF